jgi:type II secretory pathway component GspD/PulD (secretin)
MRRVVVLVILSGGMLLGQRAPAAASETPVLVLEQSTYDGAPAVEKVPFLGDLPFLGRLFQKTQPETRKVPILSDLPFLGRLFTIERKPAVRKVPILADIPILGQLFQHTPER